MSWGKHTKELEKLIQILSLDDTWELLGESDNAKVAALKMLKEIRDSVNRIESDISAMIVEMSAYEKFSEITLLIAQRFRDLTG